MSNNFSNLRLTGLYFYIIILLSIYTVEIFANPIKPSSTFLQKRQVYVTITQTSTITGPAIPRKTIQKEVVETFSPSKLMTCNGPVKLSKIKISISKNKNPKTINFFVEGESSLAINDAFVEASIYWDNKRSIDRKMYCPFDEDIYGSSCLIGGTQPFVTFNYTTPLTDEFLGITRFMALNAFMLLSVTNENGEILGCATVSFNGVFTDTYPYLFNVPLIVGAITTLICFVAVKYHNIHTSSQETPCPGLGPNDTPGSEPSGNMHPSQNDTPGSGKMHPGPKDTSGSDPSGNMHPSPKASGSDPSGNMHPNPKGTSSGNIPKDTPGSDPSGNSGSMHPSPKGTPGSDSSGNMHPSTKDTTGSDPSGKVQPGPKDTSGPDPGGNMHPSPKDTSGSDPSGNMHPSPKADPSGNMYPSPKADSSGNMYPSPKDTSGPDPSGNMHPSPTTQVPSIYDIINIAQFIVTTALVSLPGLPSGYRDVASKIGWAMGLPAGLSSILSKVADDGVRKAICHMTNFCSNLSNNRIAYNGDNACAQGNLNLPTPPLNSSGFTSFGKQLNIPDYNLFFVSIVILSIMLGITIVIALLIWLLTWLCKRLWKKLPFLETVAKNVHFLMLGGILRVLKLYYFPITIFTVYQLSFIDDCWLLLLLAAICMASLSLGTAIFCGYKILRDLLKDREGFDNPVHTLFYGTLYTEYQDDPDLGKTRIWFFIIQFSYDFLRAVIIGLGQRSPIAQIAGLMMTETVFFALLVYFKPFKTTIMNYLKIFISFLKFAIVCLLIPFLGDTSLQYRLVIEIIMKSLQLILEVLLVAVAILGLIILVRSFWKKRKRSQEEDKNELVKKVI